MPRHGHLPAATVAAMLACVAPVAAGGGDVPLFSRHVVPLFSRLGCNAGLCHGAVQGKGGFRLSLFGAEPALDHQRLLREWAGRRVNLHDPDGSLLLLKATGRAAHGGGKRLEPDGPEYHLLRQWIAGGARLDPPDQARVTRLVVTPASRNIAAGQSYALRVEATFADGGVEDVTQLCTFESRDPVVAAVDRAGQVRTRSAGAAALVARYRAQPALAGVFVPANSAEELSLPPAENFVDEHIFDMLRRLRSRPADLCDDATFLRRASLDVAGELPAPDEVRAFLADTRPDKRTRKVEELLARPAHSALWATRLCDLLKPRISYQDFTHQPAPGSTRRFYEWLRARLRENIPYDELVERMLVATSLEGRSRDEWVREVIELCEEDTAGARPAGPGVYAGRRTLDLFYHRFDSTGVGGAVQVAHVFLGLRLQCARCHRHPTDVWTQDDLLSFANFFQRVRGNTGVLSVQEAGEVKKRAGGGLSAEEKKQLQEEAKQLAERAKQLQQEANQAADKAAKERLQREAKALQDKSGALSRASAVLECSQVFPTRGNVFGWATVTSPIGSQKSERFRFLGETQPVSVADGQDPRELVVAWLRRPDNPFFAKAIVNRVWAHYFDRGLIDPPDDLSPLNPPSHPELLRALCDDFVRGGYDLRRLHRTILTSRAYQLASRADARHFAAFTRRRLPAEVLLDAIAHATGVGDKFNPMTVPPGARALEVPYSVLDGAVGNPFVEYSFTVFGRPTRNPEAICDCERESRPSLVQSLHLANHPEVLRKINDPQGRLALLLKEHADDVRCLEELYLGCLGRLPTPGEVAICRGYLKESPTRQKGWAGLMWGLLNTREFVLNY